LSALESQSNDQGAAVAKSAILTGETTVADAFSTVVVGLAIVALQTTHLAVRLRGPRGLALACANTILFHCDTVSAAGLLCARRDAALSNLTEFFARCAAVGDLTAFVKVACVITARALVDVAEGTTEGGISGALATLLIEEVLTVVVTERRSIQNEGLRLESGAAHSDLEDEL